MNDNMKKIDNIVGEYKYGFHTEGIEPEIDLGKGLSEEIVRKISEIKGEPEWMTEFRVDSYKKFLEIPNPDFGPGLDHINFDEFTYYKSYGNRPVNTWDEVPDKIKETFEKLGIPEAERNYLAGAATQFDSEVVYSATQKELDESGIIFLDTDTGLRKYPEIFKKYFGSVVPNDDNKYAALNSAVWSGGTFIYVPKGAVLKKPLQSYFRINANQMGQFERTLIIVEEGAQVNYIEGCTAPKFSKDSLHAAIVEIVVLKDAQCRYTTIQNWSDNVINLVTKRAHVYEGGHMEWIDGNLGSNVNMKYPSCILLGERAKGTNISIAFASTGQNQDVGARMIHLAPNTTSNIISKSIARGGGAVNYRGKVLFGKNAKGSKSNIECDTIILDGISTSDTIPINVIRNSEVFLQHEATVSKISEDQLFYLMSRGISEEDAVEMIIMGFIEPFSKELPMEYAIELNQLIKLEMEGSLGWSERMVILKVINNILRVLSVIAVIVAILVNIVFESNDKILIGSTISVFMSSLAIIIVTYIPSYLLKKDIVMSKTLYAITLSSIVLTMGGGFTFRFYEIFNYYDTIVHFLNGGILVIIIFTITYYFAKDPKNNILPIVLLSVLGAISLGTLWEIYEFAIDGLFAGSNMQRFKDVNTGIEFIGRTALKDTMVDLIVDMIGAILGGILLYMDALRRGKLINSIILRKQDKSL